MERRKITIVSTKFQGKRVVETDATTLRELKVALDSEGIDYTDSIFFEGLSRTELVDDSSQLPTNVIYKGNHTNELVFMLTNVDKKNSSGLGENEVEGIVEALRQATSATVTLTFGPSEGREEEEEEKEDCPYSDAELDNLFNGQTNDQE